VMNTKNFRPTRKNFTQNSNTKKINNGSNGIF
jgi:hypothetical protein